MVYRKGYNEDLDYLYDMLIHVYLWHGCIIFFVNSHSQSHRYDLLFAVHLSNVTSTSLARQESKGKFGVYFVYVLFLHLKRHDV